MFLLGPTKNTNPLACKRRPFILNTLHSQYQGEGSRMIRMVVPLDQDLERGYGDFEKQKKAGSFVCKGPTL